MRLNRIRIRPAATLAFGLLAVVVLLISAFALNSLSRSNARFTENVQDDAQRERLASDVRGAVARRAIAASNLLLVTEATDRDLEKRALIQAHHDVGKAMAALKQARDIPREPGRLNAAFKEMERIEGRYGPILLYVVDEALDGRRDNAVAKMNAECNPLLASLLTATSDYVGYERERALVHLQQAQDANKRDRMLMVLITVAFVVAAGLLSWTIGKVITRQSTTPRS